MIQKHWKWWGKKKSQNLGQHRGHDLGALGHAVDGLEAQQAHADVLSSVGLRKSLQLAQLMTSSME